MNEEQILTWFTGKAAEHARKALQVLDASDRQGYWIPGASRKVRAALNKASVAQRFSKEVGFSLWNADSRAGLPSGLVVTALRACSESR